MARTDTQIKRNIVEHLSWDSRLDASNIKVEVEGGKATLSGTVPDHPSRQIACMDVFSVHGVVDVENDLSIDFKVAGPPDEDIEAKVRRVLDELSTLNMEEIDVRVKNGHLTIEGPCRSLWTKQRAEDLASLVTGVLSILNNLYVVPEEDIADEDIVKTILSALRRSAEVDARSVTVSVQKGTVRLSGIVPTWRAREAARNAALCTEGVVHIDDRLVVKTAG